MNELTSHFVNDEEFKSLSAKLYERYKSTKPFLNEELLKAVGLTVVKFQYLENNVRRFIEFLSGLGTCRSVIDILTLKSSFERLVGMLSELAVEKGFHRMDELNQLIAKACEAEQIRNQIIHMMWLPGMDEAFSYSGNQSVDQYGVEELLLIAETFDRISSAIEAMLYEWIEFSHNNGVVIKGVAHV